MSSVPRKIPLVTGAITSVFMLLVLLPCATVADEGEKWDAGQPGEFLRWGVGSRALAMGRTYVAVSDDASAIYWNPAGIICAEKKEFTSTYADLFYDTRYTYFAIAVPRVHSYPDNRFLDFLFGRESAWGFGWVNLTAGDIEQRTRDDERVGSFDSHEQALFLSFARELVNTWGIFGLGGNLKLVNQGFSGLDESELSGAGDVESVWGAGIDLGLTVDPINFPIIKLISSKSLKYLLPLRAGFNIQNVIRPEIGFSSVAEETLPRVYRWGLSYKLDIRNWDILVAYDQEHFAEKNLGRYFGLEIEPGVKNLYLRAGRNNREDKTTFGGGVKLDFLTNAGLKLDYAFGHHPDLGGNGGDHRFSLAIEFGERYGPEYFHNKAQAANVIPPAKDSERKRKNAYLQIIAKYPNEKIGESATALAETYDPDNAKRYWALVGGLGEAEWLFRMAKDDLKKGNNKKARIKAEKAVEEYKKVSQQQDFNDDQRLNYGEALMIVGEKENWDKAIRQIQKINTPSQRYNYQLGVCYKMQGEWEHAASQFRKAIEYGEDPKYSMRLLSFLGLGDCLNKMEDYQHAIDTLEVVLNYQSALADDYPRYPALGGDKHVNDANDAEYLVYFRDKHVVDDAQYLIAQCYFKLGQNDKALKAFAKIPRYYPRLDRSKAANEKINERMSTD